MPLDPEVREALRAAAVRADAALARRNEMIAGAVACGGSLREVAKLTGVSYGTVQRIAAAARRRKHHDPSVRETWK